MGLHPAEEVCKAPRSRECACCFRPRSYSRQWSRKNPFLETLDTCTIVSIAGMVAGENGKDIHQTDVTRREYEVAIDTLSEVIVYARHIVRCAGRHWAEGLEPSTVKER